MFLVVSFTASGFSTDLPCSSMSYTCTSISSLDFYDLYSSSALTTGLSSSRSLAAPEEEFFMLAILALKMQHTENHEAEFIYQIDS
jgi:hypothetical protein